MESEYILITVRAEDKEKFIDVQPKFEALVSEKMNEGWVLVGGVNIYTPFGGNTRLTQALTRKKKVD